MLGPRDLISRKIHLVYLRLKAVPSKETMNSKGKKRHCVLYFEELHNRKKCYNSNHALFMVAKLVYTNNLII